MTTSKKKITLQVPDELADSFELHAEVTGRSISDLVEDAIRLYLVRHSGKLKERSEHKEGE